MLQRRLFQGSKEDSEFMRDTLVQSRSRLVPREAYGRWLVRLLGLALFAVLIAQFDVRQVVRLATSIPWLAWLSAFALNGAILVASAVRWQGVVTTLPEASSFTLSQAASQFLRFYAIGLATPGRAGELARTWALSRAVGIRLGAAAALVLLERGIDLAVSLAMALAALAVLPGVWLRPLFWLGLAGTAVLILTLTVGRHALRWTIGLLGGRLQQLWSGLSTELATLPITWRHFRGMSLAVPIFWTLFTHAAFLGVCVALGVGLGIQVPPFELALAAALASVIGMLPVTVLGLGTREASLLLLLAPYGVAGETAIAYSLALLLVMYGGGILPGAILWLLPARSTPKVAGI
jgi:uncharacterized membrane protein YbhN (UPF0104 family)